MSNEEIQKTPSDKTPDVIELDAVEINTPRPSENDVFENTQEYRGYSNQKPERPPFVYTFTQNSCNNCCLGALILFILFVLAIF